MKKFFNSILFKALGFIGVVVLSVKFLFFQDKLTTFDLYCAGIVYLLSAIDILSIILPVISRKLDEYIKNNSK